MRTLLRRIGKLEIAAAVVRAQPSHRHRIEFIEPGTMTVKGVLLLGDGWTDEERAAALAENADLRIRYPDKDR